MAYDHEWEEDTPDGSITPANTIDDIFLQLKAALGERLSEVVIGFRDDEQKPKVIRIPIGSLDDRPEKPLADGHVYVSIDKQRLSFGSNAEWIDIIGSREDSESMIRGEAAVLDLEHIVITEYAKGTIAGAGMGTGGWRTWAQGPATLVDKEKYVVLGWTLSIRPEVQGRGLTEGWDTRVEVYRNAHSDGALASGHDAQQNGMTGFLSGLREQIVPDSPGKAYFDFQGFSLSNATPAKPEARLELILLRKRDSAPEEEE